MLLLLVGIFLGLVALGASFSHPRVWWLLLPMVLVSQVLMVAPTWGLDMSLLLIVNPGVLVYYLCFFLFGAFMHHTNLTIDKRWAFALIPIIPVFYVGLFFEFGVYELGFICGTSL